MILYFTTYFEPFTVDGVLCKPIPINDGWLLPLGWEYVLEDNGISYDVIEYTEEDVDGDGILDVVWNKVKSWFS